jgi:hypothetical protein
MATSPSAPSSAAIACAPSRRDLLRRFAMRGLRVEGAAVLIAVCLWAIGHQAFDTTLVDGSPSPLLSPVVGPEKVPAEAFETAPVDRLLN